MSLSSGNSDGEAGSPVSESVARGKEEPSSIRSTEIPAPAMAPMLEPAMATASIPAPPFPFLRRRLA